MKSKLHLFIFAGMILGVVSGFLLHYIDDAQLKQNLIWFFDLFGRTVFIGALKMIVAPLIFFSILNAITSLSKSKELMTLGSRAFIYYLATTSIAVIIGLFFVLMIQPGHNDMRDEIRSSWSEKKAELHEEYDSKEEKLVSAKQKTALDAVKSNLERIILNPFKALTESQSLGIIFFAVLFGVALIAIGAPGQPVLPVISGINAAIMKLTGWIMTGSPFFIFCLIASLVGTLGWTVFEPLMWYVATVLIGIAAHIIVLLSILKIFGKTNPFFFLKCLRKPWMIAFSTRSSAATLPVTMDCVKNELSCSEKSSDFILPLGATINMDGTALYEGVAVIFLIQLFGGMPGAEITLTPLITVIIFVTAVLASIGAAAVPDAGLITMVLVANAVGLSVEYIPIIFAVDAFLDMFRTSTNVMGDSIGAVVLDRYVGDRLS